MADTEKSSAVAPEGTPRGIDPRGPRFGAIVTTVVLAVTVLLDSGWLLAAQTLVFATGSILGLGAAPYGRIYRALVRPRLGPPAELEAPEPPRFAQTVGFAVAGVGVVLWLFGVPHAVLVFGGMALVAAFLNGAFGLCLGCELYLLIARLRPATRAGA